MAGPLVTSGLPAVAAADPYAVSVVQTVRALGQHLAAEKGLHFAARPPAAGTPLISVNDLRAFQRVSGFGAAMTDSSAWLVERELPTAARQALMAQLFSGSGLGLGFLRVAIGASDYTATGVPYSYDDVPSGQRDPTLAHFSIAHDRGYLLPSLRQALALNPQLALLATPWSPPAWMKGNDSLGNAGNHGTLRGAAYGPWAAYIVRFLQAYARAGVPVSALTPQNEPGNPTRYPGLNLSEGAEANWITQDLVPALTRARLSPKLFGIDAGWASGTYAQQTLSGPAARDLTGLSWHCYYGSPAVMSTLHSRAPGLATIVDECSPGISAIPTSEVVISSLRNWSSTVALWNLALDPHGGPVQTPNTGCPGCYGLATVDEASHTYRLDLPYYQLGQASRFIQPGARRVSSNSFVTYDYTRPGVNFVSAGLDDVALVNPDGSRVLIAYDNSNQPVSFAIGWRGRYVTYTLPAWGTATLVWDRP
jgi:O-glycosyl hydrolase